MNKGITYYDSFGEAYIFKAVDEYEYADEYADEYKYDEGKWRFSLVPPFILKAIASVREDGIKKYKDPEGWKQVSVERYYNAMMRHIVAMHENRYALDPETEKPHAWHVACNLAFMLELMSTLDDQQWKM